MSNFKVGDIIRVKETQNPDYRYYDVGHTGLIINTRDPMLVDFNNQRNSFTYGDGYWYVSYSNAEVVED